MIEITKENFEEMSIPTNFVNSFESKDEFRKWCDGGTYIDLQYALESFKEYDEIYEYCTIIKEVMDSKERIEFEHVLDTELVLSNIMEIY